MTESSDKDDSALISKTGAKIRMQRSYKQQSAQIRETVLVRTIESTLDKDAALLQAT